MKTNRWFALLLISISELLALSLWFSASVIVNELKVIWNLSPVAEAWVSASVPIGFVVGALISAYFGFSDRFNPRKFFVFSAFIGAVFNGLLMFTEHAVMGMLLRFLTGITLAGIYPTAVKLLSQWFPKKRGLAIGILIGALTLGSSLPHFIVVFFSTVNWKLVILVSSALALISSCIMQWMLKDQPNSGKRTIFSFQLITKVLRNKPVMLANFGYFGHMWELYAMWTWLPAFLTASFEAQSKHIPSWFTAFSAFLSIGIAGVIGCILGGYLADKISRSFLTILSMAGSAICAIVIGFTFGHAIPFTLFISFLWGMFVIADSAQFSAAISDFADTEYIGTALTFQMCIGFLITIFSINLIPILQKVMGWEWVFMLLSIGPLIGIVSMLYFSVYEKK